MGARLAMKALQLGPPIGDRPTLILVAMSLVAHDTDDGTPDGARYFGGWSFLAELLGYTAGDQSGKRAVARYLGRLADAGLITREDGASRGRNAVYRLHLDLF